MPSFGDSNKTSEKDEAIARIAGATGLLADVTLDGGKNKLETNITVVSNNTTFGQDPLPDTWFRVDNAGAISDTIRVQIAATTKDSSIPDRDAPAVDVTIILTSSEVGDELALRDLCILDLNADPNFSASLKAQKVKDRAIIHIVSKFFSMPTEFYERTISGDVAVTPTGTTTITLGFNKLISRTKPSSLAQDPDNPHNLGILGISGTVITQPGGIGNRFGSLFKNGGSSNMRVDGSSTPVDFTIDSDANDDIFVESFRLFGGGSSIKFSQFLSKSGTGLVNGIEIKIKSDNKIFIFEVIKTTEDFKNLFSTRPNEFRIDEQPGQHQFIAEFMPSTPFPLRISGAFTTDDFVQIKIQDDLISGLSQLEAFAFGFKKGP